MIDKQKYSEAIMLLGKGFNNPTPKIIEQSVRLLRESQGGGARVLTPIAFSEVASTADNFIRVGPRWYQDWHGGGMRPKEFKLWGACPHGGKTHLLVWDGAQYILGDYRVLHFNGEDVLADIRDYYTLAVGIENIVLLQENLKFVDMEDSRLSVLEVEEGYNQLKTAGWEAEIVIVDHVDLLRTAGGKQDWEGVSEVMADLCLFAKRTNTIVISASQQNFPTGDAKGMARFYRAKVGKAGEPSMIFMVDNVVNNEYTISRYKARGRRRIVDNTKTLLCEWETMQVEEL